MAETLNPFMTEEQERIRELIFRLYKEEMELSQEDHRLLAPFVKTVREEQRETTTPGQRGIRRAYYYMLNERGRMLYQQWQKGQLDHLIKLPSGRGEPS